jgi:hypothetical protein
MANRFVIAGGWTVGQWDTRALVNFGHVIGVNDAALWTNVHTCLTMDRLWFENRIRYLAARRVYNVWVREKCDCNVKYDGKPAWNTFKHFAKPFPSVTVGELHGSNSGACAMNLAMQGMQDGDTLYLLGYDMQRGPGNEPYWYPPYPWAKPGGATGNGKYKEWSAELHSFYECAKTKGMNIFNVTNRSTLVGLPRITYDQMIEMVI